MTSHKLRTIHARSDESQGLNVATERNYGEIMKIVDQTIRFEEVKGMAGKFFVDMVKAVVDIDREVIALDAGLHSDLEKILR